MAKQQIGLLFGVKGNGSLSGESGQLILQQLNKIAKSIDNTNNRIKVSISLNENQTRQLIQTQLNNISKGLQLTIGENAQQQSNAVFKNSTAFEKQETVYQNVIAKITEYQVKYKETLKSTPELAAKLENLNQQLSAGTFVGTENKANQMFVSLTNQIRKTGGESETLGQKIKQIFGEKLGPGIMGSAPMLARRALQQIYNNVVELDKAVVNLQISTSKNRNEAKNLIEKYSDLGRELGTTTSEVAKSADTWLRQGYSIADTNELVKQSTILSKLGQMESAEASAALTGSLKGYQLAAKDAASVVDKLTAVDMKAAASAGDIAATMSECANSARIAGVDINTLIGYLTTVKEVTQDSNESVGSFAKTMFARMGNMKAGNLENPESGENLSDVEPSLSGVGIQLRSANNQFRDLEDVLSEVAADWDHYSNVQQHAIAVAFAGAQQQEKFLVLMENYGKATEYAGISTESAGTALDKYTNSYLPSVEAAQDSFTASFEQFSSTLLNSDTVAGVLRLGDGLMQLLTGLSKIKALLPVIVAGFMSWKNVGKRNSRNMPAYAQLQLAA